MSDIQQDPLLKSKWNFSAIVALLVIASVNIGAGAAFFLGKITWQEWLAATGPINGLVLGWVSKEMSSGPSL